MTYSDDTLRQKREINDLNIFANKQTNKKYAIVNDIDYPRPDLVTEVIRGRHYYMSRYNNKDKRNYDGMVPAQPTFLEVFGFKIIEREFQVDFELVSNSLATYNDGSSRKWQGAKKFSLPKVNLI